MNNPISNMDQDLWKFFISARNFLEEIELVEHFIPQIDNLRSSFLGIQCNASIQQYLSVFPEESTFNNSNLGSLFFSSESIRKATSKALREGIVEEISQVTSVEGWEEYSDSFLKQELLFLQYDEINSSYLFIKNQYQNPSLYIYWGADVITLAASSLSLYIRNSIFWVIIELVKTNYFNRTKVKSKWVDFYCKFTEITNSRNELIRARHEFNSFLKKSEIDESNLDLHGFENKFIKFLQPIN
jgi:hypothetical protein